MHSLPFCFAAWGAVAQVVAGGYIKANINKGHVEMRLTRRQIPAEDLDENIVLAINGSVSRIALP